MVLLWENREFCSTSPHFVYIIIHTRGKIKCFHKKSENFFLICQKNPENEKSPSIGEGFVIEYYRKDVN